MRCGFRATQVSAPGRPETCSRNLRVSGVLGSAGQPRALQLCKRGNPCRRPRRPVGRRPAGSRDWRMGGARPTRGPRLAFTAARVSRAWCSGWLCPMAATRIVDAGGGIVAPLWRGCRINQADSHCSSDGGRGESKIARFAALVPIQLRIEWRGEVLSRRPIDALASGVVFPTATGMSSHAAVASPAKTSVALGEARAGRVELRVAVAVECNPCRRARDDVNPGWGRRRST